jgi:hypothetical protein
MKKYIIEGGIDFYEELYKSLDIEETNEKTEEDNNLCLITNQSLKDNFVKLNCGHKFNYGPLFLDLKNHKQKFNGMEGSTGKLATDEIRCPYCRTKQKGVLPYYEELEFPKTNGVNYINPFTSSKPLSCSYKTCEFVSLNTEYDPSGNNPVEFNSENHGNCKFVKCFNIGTKLGTILAYGENYEDEKHYCWHHKKVLIKNYKKEVKDKQKTHIKKAKEEEKQKAKDEAKKSKEEAKDEAKKAKEEAKKLLKNKLIIEKENVVIGETNFIDLTVNTGCIEILKSGQNKGKSCGCKILLDDLCNRHFKIKNGIMNNI